MLHNTCSKIYSGQIKNGRARQHDKKAVLGLTLEDVRDR